MFAGAKLIGLEIRAGTEVQAVIPASHSDFIGVMRGMAVNTVVTINCLGAQVLYFKAFLCRHLLPQYCLPCCIRQIFRTSGMRNLLGVRSLTGYFFYYCLLFALFDNRHKIIKFRNAKYLYIIQFSKMELKSCLTASASAYCSAMAHFYSKILM
jgi:hypothetical protein